ncbi:hypothetical protein [Ancylobacter terrae]|uniref:hypothetical protein n=1 Tax=Ancylobacter sp. sgz301288 TaxID=3342077 RepID=UPI00385D597D
MSEAEEQGTPYPDGNAGRVDDWSARIYAALRGWPDARAGAWTRWEPGYLLLTIDHARGRDIDRIVLYTADELLKVAFGYWDEEYPVPGLSDDVEPEALAAEARRLVEQWLDGEFRTAVVLDVDGGWLGTRVVERGEDPVAGARAWMASLNRTADRIELRSPFRDEWRIIPLAP